MQHSFQAAAHISLDRERGLLIPDTPRTWFGRHQWRLFIISLFINDLIMVGLGLRLAFAVRFGMSVPFFKLDIVPNLAYYQQVSLVLVGLFVAAFAASGLYKQRHLLGGTQEYSLIFRAVTVGMLLVVIAGFLEEELILARGWLIASWGLSFFLVALGRFLLRRVVYGLRHKGYYLQKALIVGANAEGRSLAEQLVSWRTSGLLVLGFVDDRLPAGNMVVHGLQNFGQIDEIDQFVTRYGVQEVIITTSALSRAKMLELFQHFGMRDGVNLRLSSGLFEIITTGLWVKEMAFVPLVGVNKVRLTGLDRVMKFILDYSIAIALLPFILPVLAVLALLVRLDSPGPVIYRRRVMGVNGTQFDALKFRTMHVNGDEILANYPQLQEELAREHKLKWDPRVTRVGSVLRKLSLDELPQIFNVLRGQMSLVGPRMIVADEMKKYDQWAMNLLTVAPGITGLWQVSGRSDLSYEQRVRLDMQYIRNWTIWQDLQILMQTIPAVIRRRGAY